MLPKPTDSIAYRAPETLRVIHYRASRQFNTACGLPSSPHACTTEPAYVNCPACQKRMPRQDHDGVERIGPGRQAWAVLIVTALIVGAVIAFHYFKTH